METDSPGLRIPNSMIERVPIQLHNPPQLTVTLNTPETTDSVFVFPIAGNTRRGPSPTLPTDDTEALGHHFDVKLGLEEFAPDCDATGLVENTSVATSPGFLSADSDHESVVSDYSEMAEPVKEHLANMHVMQEAELLLGIPAGSMPRHRALMRRNPGEDEADFYRRQRKQNFLSLAQEFAELKKRDSDTLPFNLHRRKSQDTSYDRDDDTGMVEENATSNTVSISAEIESQSGDISDSGVACSESSTDANSVIVDVSVPDIVRDLQRGEVENDFGVSPSSASAVRRQQHDHTQGSEPSQTVCGAAPVCDKFDDFSHLSDRTLEDTKQMQQHLRQRERENIRLRLVVGDDEDVASINSRISSSVNLTAVHESSASLSMCYVNEDAFDDDWDSVVDDDGGSFRDDAEADDDRIEMRHPDVIASANAGTGVSRPAPPLPLTGFRNPFGRDAASEGVVAAGGEKCRTTQHRHDPEQTAWKMSRYDRLSLQRHGVGQLQFIINDQLNRIEALNAELMRCLVERDELHRRQDSLLLDLEDLSGFVNKNAAVATGNDGRR